MYIEQPTAQPTAQTKQHNQQHKQNSRMKPTIYNRKDLKQHRKSLRQDMTPAESRLWTLLKNKQLENRKFRRQQSMGPYIVDFYCPAENLVLELDGDVHNDPMRIKYDVNRQEYLENLGLTVLRFENHLVFSDIDNVLERIKQSFKD
jgi:very-short-patch-repair endonuclease